MSQEIEIEFKNMLTKHEFDHLVQVFQLNEQDFLTQHNDYFDTSSFELKSKGAALRIREKENRFVLTLKEPHTVGKLETHQFLSKKDVQQFFQSRELDPGDVQQRLERLSIKPENLQHLGRLTTHRAEFPHEEGLFVLDHSCYLDTEDYEMEWEFNDHPTGQKRFESFLERYQIPKRPTQNKIMRFFLYKKSKEMRQD
ncbi:CYTH domain-containing protein [Pullulanibacillus sp. KACC 23026]|uniref:CYTH domain-containing protein n=1 Tax=Pullulanibacillus sp. KACC 23026 TaxID=3028315 RepID=UPI0023B09DBC|nr:CYTH domain-containing protein [Pullulanibacillus sp. KACC 23026]WEG11910.1 CYTH domain-containing protein [Pullulanibacillus sp. KACC 23026]